MNFIEFVNSHKAEAFKIRINYDAIDKQEEMQQKFRDAESPEELQEVRDFAKKAIEEIKTKIQKMLRNEIHLTTYQNVVPPYLPLVRMWFEYKELYEKTEEPKSEVSELNKKKELPEYEMFFTDRAMLTDRNILKNEFRKSYLKDPETIGNLIANFENDNKLRSLSGKYCRRNLYKILISGFDPLGDNGHKKVENDLNKAYKARKQEIDDNKNNSVNV